MVPGISPLVGGYSQWIAGHTSTPALPRPLYDFLTGAFGPLSPIMPMPVDIPQEETGRAVPRRWQYPVGWNLPMGQPGQEGLKLAPFDVLWQYADMYCLSPETRVLCADLRWQPIGSLLVGDSIVAYDEQPGPSGRRKFRVAEVQASQRLSRPSYRVRFTDGREVVASAEHLWLRGHGARSAALHACACTKTFRRRQELGRHRRNAHGWAGAFDPDWITTAELSPGSTIRDFGRPWQEDLTREAGYLAGAYDGEASLSSRAPGATFGVFFAQKPGPVLDHVRALVEGKGYATATVDGSGCSNLGITSAYDTLRFLGEMRPLRLLEKVPVWLDGRSPFRRRGAKYAVVESVEFLGDREVVAIGTSTKTLIAEGLFSHNSVVRACINIRREEMAGLTWDIGPTTNAQSVSKGNRSLGKDQRDRANKLVQWFRRIDSNYRGFQTWFTAALEEQIVTDATSLYLAPTRAKGKGLFGKDLAELQLLSGKTIRPLLDMHGATPRPPAPAYQQYLWGVPRSELQAVMTGADLEEMADRLRDAGADEDIEPDEEYRADQLLYLPRLRRAHTPYGFSAIEQALVPITLGMSRQNYLIDFYSEGSIPGVFVVAGDQYVTPAQQRQLQDTLNAIAGDIAWKHRVIVLPPGSKTDPQKDMDGQWQADQMVAEQVAMILHIQPHEIGMLPGGKSGGLSGGKGVAEQQASSVNEQRTEPDRKWWKEACFDWIIQDVFGQDDLEWKWLDFEEEEDDAKAATTDQINIQSGKASIDERRVEDGLDPWNFPLTQSPFIIVGPNIVPLDPNVPPPALPAPSGGAPGGAPAGPAGVALSHALQPELGKNPEKPKNNPAAALLSDKKKDRKKARNELEDRFHDNLKAVTKKPPQDQQPTGQPTQETGTAPSTAVGPGEGASGPAAPTTAAQAGAGPSGGVVAPPKGKKNKITVAQLVKAHVAYKGDLTKIVYRYLLRSYPEKAVEWVKDGEWEYDPKVKLSDINMARRPGGRDPEKVTSISDTLGSGASMDPIVLVERQDQSQYRYDIADGWHRTLGAEQAGWDAVPAFIGEGFDDKTDWGLEMQSESDSVKKAALAEIGVLRRYLRKGGDVTKFVANAIDSDTMRLFYVDIGLVGRDAALDRARDRVSADLWDIPLEVVRTKVAQGVTLSRDEIYALHKAAKAEGAF